MMNLAERVSRIERLMLEMSLALIGITHDAPGVDKRIKDIAGELLKAVDAPEFKGYVTEHGSTVSIDPTY